MVPIAIGMVATQNAQVVVPIAIGMVATQNAQVVELVDTQDLKSCVHCERIGSSPIPGTKSEVL